MPFFYHRTSKFNVPDILEKGILTGADVQRGERLPFVMGTVEEYPVTTGSMAIFAFEIDEDDPRLVYVNEKWIEYHASVPVSALRALAFPPSHNYQVMDLLNVCDWDRTDARYKRVWRYVAINSPVIDHLLKYHMP